jgi:hypothetical protein
MLGDKIEQQDEEAGSGSAGETSERDRATPDQMLSSGKLTKTAQS